MVLSFHQSDLRNPLWVPLRATDGNIRDSVVGPKAVLFALMSFKAVANLNFCSAIDMLGEGFISIAGMMKRLKRSR